MRTVKINRKKWLRGNGYSYLWHRLENAGCCLGHVCKQISRKTECQLNDLSCPEDVFKKKSILTDINGQDNNFTIEAMKLNDSSGLSEKNREQKLIKLFRKNKIKLTFYN